MALTTTSMSNIPKKEKEGVDFYFVKSADGKLAIRHIRGKEIKVETISEKKEFTPVKTQIKKFVRGKK